MDIERKLARAVTDALERVGDHGPWTADRSLGGGQQAVHLLTTPRDRYVLKHGMPGSMAVAEARGLVLLAESEAVRVPSVVAYGEEPGFVLLEHVTGRGRFDQALLGRQLASLHGVTSAAYGLSFDTYCGRSRQPNEVMGSWVSFYRERRLRPQMVRAGRAGRMPAERRRRLEGLMGRLGDFIDDAACRPSLVHGDLWSGNAITGPHGEPALIDPAVSYSDREAELGMMRLFGGFDEACFAAYEEAWPLAAGWRERSDLYQLYHLLNHLNLFGESYGGAVDTILRRYA
jgi:fructosamine-3-kinase